MIAELTLVMFYVFCFSIGESERILVTIDCLVRLLQYWIVSASDDCEYAPLDTIQYRDKLTVCFIRISYGSGFCFYR